MFKHVKILLKVHVFQYYKIAQSPSSLNGPLLLLKYVFKIYIGVYISAELFFVLEIRRSIYAYICDNFFVFKTLRYLTEYTNTLNTSQNY